MYELPQLVHELLFDEELVLCRLEIEEFNSANL